MNRKLANSELNRSTISEYKEDIKHPIVIVLDDVRSLLNVGSIFRTCDSFKVERLLLCGITGKPPHRDIQKTALGATESVDWKYEASAELAIQRLKKEGYKIVCVEQSEGAVSPEEAFNTKIEKTALVFGNEVKGVNQLILDSCDTVVEIPQSGTKHSLNVSVAAGIVIWEAYKAVEKPA